MRLREQGDCKAAVRSARADIRGIMSLIVDGEKGSVRLKPYEGEPLEWLSWKGKFEALLDAHGLLDFVLDGLEATSTDRVLQQEV